MKKILQKMQRTLAVLLAVTMVVTLLPQNVAYVSAAENMAEGGVAANEVQPEDGIEETSEPENDVEDGTSESEDDAEDETSESQDDENGSDRNDTGENNPDEDPQEEVTDVPDSESEETENDDFNDAPEAEEEVDEAATPAAQAESDAVDDVSDDEILTEEQIPDATLRKLLEYELNKNNYSGTPVELTKANLKIITFLSCIVNDNNGDKLAEIGADKAITNLKGIEYLTNLTSLYMSCQDFTDISPVASLSNLETLSLTDCNITTIPDLTGLSNLSNITIHFNKIPASEFTDAKMSANLLANQPNWKEQANSQREDASFIVSDIYPYAADSGEFYFYVELSGTRYRDWTVTVEFDGNSDTSYPLEKYNSDRRRYLSAKITGLSSGVHSVTLKAQESYDGDSLNVTKQITLKPVETMSLYQKYLQPGANHLSFFAFIPLKSNEKVTRAKLAEHGNSGNVVGITHYDQLPSVYNSYAGFWLQANGGNDFTSTLPNEMGDVCPYVSGTIYLSYRNFTSSSYDLIIETSQGSYTIENYAVSEYANPIVTYISSNNIYDNQGDYYYVQLQGEGLAPDKFYPVLKLEDGTEVSEFVSLTSTYNGNMYTYKLKKLSNFPKSGYVYCDFASKDDYPKVTMQEGRTNRLWISGSQYIATIVYNAKEKKFLLYAASDLEVGTKLQIGIKKGGYPTYDYSSNSYQDALATAEVTITGSETEVVFEDLRETPNYNGNAWAYFSARWQTGSSYQQTSGYVACYTSGFTNQSNAVSFGKQYYPTGTEIPITVNVTNNTVFGNGDELNATLTKDGTSITTKLTASVTGTTAGFTGTFTSDTIFSAGTYTLSVSNTAAGISSSTQIYLYEDNGKFYQTNQTVYSAQRNGKFYSCVSIYTANAVGLDQDKFEVEFYDLNKNKVEDENVKLEEIYVNEAYDYIYFYYSGLAERYASVYCKVTYGRELGIMPTTGEYFYNADEQTCGRLSTVGSGISLSITTGYGYRSVTSTAFPDYTVEVHDGRDGSLITSFDVNQIGIYTFTKKDLQKVIDQDPNLTKLYNLIVKRNGYIYATATRVNISYDGAGTTEPPAPKEPTGISLSQTGVTLVKGSTFTLKATLKPSDAVSTLTWTSDKEEVATVSSSGVVTAVGEGTAKITVTTANDKTASCTVTVVDYSIRNNGEAIDPSEPIVLNLADSNKKQTTLSVTKGDGSPLGAAEKLSWVSYNPSVATIDQNGKVTAIKGGTANIVATVTVNKTDIKLSCSVIVRSEVTGLELLSGRTTLESDGDTDTLQLFVTPADQASGITVTWESSNPAIATVDNGKVTTQAWTEEAFGGADEAEVSITAKTTSAISNEEVSATWPYTIVKKDTVTEVPAGTKVYAVTNVDKTLGDAAIKAQLPDGWSFADENISLATFAGVKEKDFTILRENNVTGRISYDTVTVVFTTINGMTLCDESGNEVSKLMFPMASTTGETPKINASLAYTVSGSDNNDRLLALDLRYRIEFAKNAKQDVLSAPVTDSYNGRAELSPLKAGNTTLLLQVFSDKSGGTGETVVYEKQWKVTVVDGSKGQAAINVELYDGNGKIDAKPESDGTEGIYELTVPSAETAANVYLQNNTEGNYKLTYKSSDTNVIKIGKATDAGSKKIPLTLGKAGTAVVTVTADDTLKTTKELLIKVANKKENIQASADSILISESTVTVNTALTTSDAVITVYNGFDGTLKSAILTPPANSELAGITAVPVQDGSGKNTNEIRFEVSSGNVKAGKGKLTVTIATGDDAGSAALTKEFNVNVKVTSKAPSVTVKQIDKVNTFYQDKPGHYAIGAAGETVTDVTLAPVTEGQSMNKGTDYSFDANTGVLTVNKVPEKTKKLNFRITVDGYKEVVPKNNVSVSTETANLKLSATSGTVYTDSGNMSLTIKLMDKTTGLSVDLSSVNVTAVKTSGNGTYTVSRNGDKLSLTTSEAPASKGDKLTLKFASSNWNEAKEFSFTVKPALLSKAALQLGQKSLTLYNYKGMAASTGTTLTLKGGSELSELFTSANLSITETVNQNLGASLDKTLKVAYEDGSIKVGKNGESLKAGTYKFTIALSNTLWKNPLKANLSVKVVDVDMKDAKSSAKVKVSAKGSIDVLNRQGTSVTLTPKFTNVPKDAEIKDIQLTGTDAHLFEISRRTGNQIIIRLDDDANVITKYKYAVQVTYTVEAGDTSLTLTNSDPVKVKLTQKKPKIKVSGTKVYSNTKAESKKVTFALTNSTGASIEADRIVLLNCTKDFQYDLETGALTHSLKGETARGKSYTLKFAVYPKGCGDNEKPVTVNYKITIAK